jgi:hypothetical protein
VTKFYDGTHQNQETKSLQLGLHHFNPPPKASSLRFSIKEGRAWGVNNVFRISRIKGCRLNVK